MGRADQLLGVGALLVAEPLGKAVGLVRQRPRLGGDRALARRAARPASCALPYFWIIAILLLSAVAGS